MENAKKIKFSIIIPTFNRAWCIERAINSILKQDFQDWEMIIIDDGSTDNTKNLVGKYLIDKRIKYFYKENGGVGSARNYGIKFAEGEFVMSFDSDDEFVESAFSIILDITSKNEDISLFIFGAIDQSGKKTYYMKNKIKLLNLKEFIKEEYFKGEAYLCFRRSIFFNIENRFDEEVNGGETILLWQMIRKYKVLVIDRIVRIYHTESNDSLVSSGLTVDRMINIKKIQLKLLAKYKNDLRKNNQKKLGEIYLVLARACVLSSERMKSIECFVLGIFYNPLDFRRIFLYGVSFFDKRLILNNFINYIHNRLTHN